MDTSRAGAAEEIACRAGNVDDPDHSRCVETIDVFLRAYAAECRRKALDAMPFGGLYIAGGIAPQHLLNESGELNERADIFLQVFHDDPVNLPLLKRIPLLLVHEAGAEAGIGIFGARQRALRELQIQHLMSN